LPKADIPCGNQARAAGENAYGGIRILILINITNSALPFKLASIKNFHSLGSREINVI
jgi:hypothetical protein